MPFVIKGLQVSARLMPHHAQMQKLKEAVTRSRLSQNPLELQRAVQEMKLYNKVHNINPLAGLVSLVQIPITFGLFFGVQKMCSLPLEQLTYSGVTFIPDLTATDPTMILSLAMFAFINAQIKVGLPDFNFFC